MANPLLDVPKYGQSIWYDNIRRGLITSGELQALVERDGLCGVVSNAGRFASVLSGSTDYDQALKAHLDRGVSSAAELAEELTLEDVRDRWAEVIDLTGGTPVLSSREENQFFTGPAAFPG